MKYSKLIIVFLLSSITLTDAIRFMFIAGRLNLESSTYIAAGLNYFSLFVMFHVAARSKWSKEIPLIIRILIVLLLFWNLFSIIRGGFRAVDYWDWKFLFLSSVTFSFVSLFLFFGINLHYTLAINKFILNILFPFGFLLIPLALTTNAELYSRLMIPVSLFLLFIPYLKFRHKLQVLLVAVTSIAVVLDFRTNIIKIAISLLILLTYFSKYLNLGIVKVIHILLFVVPVILLYLGITDQFNLFADLSKDQDYVVENKTTGRMESLTSDTRTFLYKEVFLTLEGNNSWIIGEGSTGKYKSEYFDYLGDQRGRYSSEVGFLNIILYTGIIGIIIYMLILFFVSYHAIYKSNNWLCKMLGLYVTSRWLLLFIEEFTQFDLNFFFFWLIIGLISSKQFREMNDSDIKTFFKFEKYVSKQ